MQEQFPANICWKASITFMLFPTALANTNGSGQPTDFGAVRGSETL